jgi:hypothetical protein
MVETLLTWHNLSRKIVTGMQKHFGLSEEKNIIKIL